MEFLLKNSRRRIETHFFFNVFSAVKTTYTYIAIGFLYNVYKLEKEGIYGLFPELQR